MGFWPPSVIVNDARRHGIEVLPVDINRSGARCTVVEGKLRLGLVSVAGIGEEGAVRIDAARVRGPFASLDDFCQRTALPKRLVERLVRVGAMATWGAPRRALLWELGKLRYPVRELALAYAPDDVDFPALTREEILEEEYALLGLSTGDHPMALIREQLAGRGLLTSRGLAAAQHGQTVRVAGMQIMHQAPPTAKGFRFITLEDEWGMIDVVVRPDVYAQCRRALHGGLVLIVEGKVERADGVVNLLAETCSVLR
jgi:error-prone DNA polymerase